MAKKPLWGMFDGEPFLDNPHLSILSANPKRRKTKMARRGRRLPPRGRGGRFVKRSRAVAHRRRRRTVGVRTGAFGRRVRRVRVGRHPMLVNPRRRRRSRKYAYVSNPRRRHYRRRHSYLGNPSFSSIFQKATLKNVGFAVVGMAGTPMLSGFVSRYLPASVAGNKWARYAISGASAWGLSFVVGKVAGKEASRAVLVGGLAVVAIGVITDLFPQLMGYITGASAGTGRYLMSAGKQPLLAGMSEYPRLRGPVTAGAPARLSPDNRF